MLFRSKTGLIPQAQQSVSAMRAAYQVNKVDFLNLVRAQITLYNYETQYWKALSGGWQALANLQAAVGAALPAYNVHGIQSPLIKQPMPVSLTPVPPLVKLLANRLSPQAGKSLVIPEGEGYGMPSLRESRLKENTNE